MLLVFKFRGIQCLPELSVARLIYAIFIVNETSSSVSVPPCSGSARPEAPPEATPKPPDFDRRVRPNSSQKPTVPTRR